MGQAGVEPEGKHPSVNAMWKNESGRMAKAKDHARMARNRGEYMSAHSIMLSAYITALGGKPVERHHPVKFFLLALWHALCMSRQINELNHNQLDVWLQFMLKLRSKLSMLGGILNKMLIEGASRGVGQASVYGKPHQLALAYMTYAEVIQPTNFMGNENLAIVKNNVRWAVDLEQLIREEPDQPQGLRQFVRVLRKAGELNLATGNRDIAMKLFERALELAKGQADAPDQVAKIEAFLPQEPR